MRILWDNQIDGSDVILTESSEDANFPVENVQDTRLAKRWRATGSSLEHLLIDSGGTILDAFGVRANEVADGDNLTTGSWTASQCTPTLQSTKAEGSFLTKLENTAAATGFMYQTFPGSSWTEIRVQALITARKDTADVARYVLRDNGAAANRIFLTITFSTKAVSVSTGYKYAEDWLDDETVRLRIQSENLTVANEHEVRVFASNAATAGESTFWTRIQIEDNSDWWSTPFMESSRAAFAGSDTFEIPRSGQFTVDVLLEPWFRYDTSGDRAIWNWFIDGTHQLILTYGASAPDQFRVYWVDGGTARALYGSRLDDGSSFIDIRQRFRLIASLDLSSGGQTDSFLVQIPQESGSVSEDADWGGVPDTLSTTFSTFYYGYRGLGGNRADSRIDYIRIYEGVLSPGTITGNATADTQLATLELIKDLDQSKQIRADSVALGGHNLTASAQVTLKASRYPDCWEGPPLEESVTWREDTLVKFFTQADYQYWRIEIEDPNNSDTYVALGRVFLGEYLQVDPSSVSEFPIDPVRTDVLSFSPSNQLYSSQGVGYNVYAYEFPESTDTMKQSIEAMWDGVGMHKPIFFMNYDTRFTEIPPAYVHIEASPGFRRMEDNWWRYSLRLREVA